ncbi:MAG: hypothetical protein AB1430_14830 [Pseudomonadota bacterium]
MSDTARSVAEIMNGLRVVTALLRTAEHAWPQGLREELGGLDAPESEALAALLHRSTHETANQLAEALREIDKLLAQVQVRRKFAHFNAQQFDRIVRQGWSLPLVQELQGELPASNLSELSAQMKQVCQEWALLR